MCVSICGLVKKCKSLWGSGLLFLYVILFITKCLTDMNKLKFLVISVCLLLVTTCTLWEYTRYVDVVDECNVWSNKYNDEFDLSIVFQENNKAYITFTRLKEDEKKITFLKNFYETTYLQTGYNNQQIILHGYFVNPITNEVFYLDSENYIMNNDSNFDGLELYIDLYNGIGEYKQTLLFKNVYKLRKIKFPLE